MAVQAKRVKDISGVTAARETKRTATQALGRFQDRTFEDLKGNEKDELLKLVAIRLGLVKPS